MELSTNSLLVVKVARLKGHRWGIEREAANLRAAEAIGHNGCESIPRIVVCEPYRGHAMLVETALAGRPMDPATVHRRPADCCDAVMAWLTNLQRPDGRTVHQGSQSFTRSIERPLSRFEETFPLSAEEVLLLEHTRDSLAPLRTARIPPVFEHGDLSHPNVIVLPNGKVGVIDWELADPRGLPAQDLFFFLTYVAFARRQSGPGRSYLPAFHAAFFGQTAWASPYVLAYARQLQLPSQMLTPLFVACWARRIARLLQRLDEAAATGEPLALDTAAWLRANRYYALWQHTLRHLHELSWHHDTPAPARGK